MLNLKQRKTWTDIFYVFQAVAISGWWLWLTFRPASRDLFFGNGFEEEHFWAFLFPDLILVSIMSLGIVVGGDCCRGQSGLTVFVLGATSYASLVTWGLWFFGLATPVSAVMMAIMLLANGWATSCRPVVSQDGENTLKTQD